MINLGTLKVSCGEEEFQDMEIKMPYGKFLEMQNDYVELEKENEELEEKLHRTFSYFREFKSKEEILKFDEYLYKK